MCRCITCYAYVCLRSCGSCLSMQFRMIMQRLRLCDDDTHPLLWVGLLLLMLRFGYILPYDFMSWIHWRQVLAYLVCIWWWCIFLTLSSLLVHGIAGKSKPRSTVRYTNKHTSVCLCFGVLQQWIHNISKSYQVYVFVPVNCLIIHAPDCWINRVLESYQVKKVHIVVVGSKIHTVVPS